MAASPTWVLDGIGRNVGSVYFDQTAAERSAGVTPVNPWYDAGHIYRYGTNTTPGTTDLASAINAALTTNKVVTFPEGDTVRIASTLLPRAGNILEGRGCTVVADNCNAITASFTNYTGRTVVRDLIVTGANSTSAYGLIAPGTLNNVDQIFQLSIEDCIFTNFHVGVHWRTVWHSSILNCRFEYVDNALEIIGGSIGSHIKNNWFIHSGGVGGSGTYYGARFDLFNYTSGAGQVPPEGVQFLNNLVYGFPNTIKIGLANFVNIIANDLYASVLGIDITTINLGGNITDNYLDCNGAGLLAAIYLRAVGAPSGAKINIVRNAMTANGAVSAVAIKVNDVSNGGQSGITIDNNSASGFPGGDILVDNAGTTTITNNKCSSSTPTSSISVPVILSGTVTVRDNECTKEISYDPADGLAGKLILGNNIKNGTTKIYGLSTLGIPPGVWTSPAFAAGDYTANGAMTWTVASGDVATYEYLIVNKTMTVNFAINTSTVGGTLNTTLKIAIPASKTASKQVFNALGVLLDNLSRVTGSCSVAASGTTINIDRTDAANFAASTDNTYAKGSITFEIN